ncbi:MULTISPECIES: glycoside hydrolase family 10 protein [unclassified Leptolyngbya]|uniref:glycoside hydrolase family 10 protein n=1 Tax=unclassified Leptolyngbya TaxID=2650499 RepID=UPI0016830A85|nr:MULTISPECIES: glycoside hydrolase family 10 protein [unclassified Leptolyngbya]MBD1914037.1 glycoside hydrolase family 10 protein [Leptolyngbya sp. FACHB-8]MBD2154008.1 glycoside hydrolase family 10 protein [Leptolyngbya sp. FACHB-16]
MRTSSQLGGFHQESGFRLVLRPLRQSFRRLSLFFLSLLICALVVAQPWEAMRAVAQRVPASAPTELRGVWLTNIDSSVMFSRRNLRNGMQRLARLHFNTVYPTVWNWGYTLYPSPLAEQVIGRAQLPDRSLRRRDVLEEAVENGHDMGLAVVPWFEFGLMAPADSELVIRHPDWVTQRRDGSKVIMEGIYPRVWLNPFHPEVQQFLLGLIGEIVTRYDVDGLQLDDHFGLPAELGYDPYTVNLYRQQHNGRTPPANSQDPEWMRWRANQITSLMQRTFTTIKRVKPNAIVALSPNSQDFSYNHYLQDWSSWERAGYIEELILQVYRDNLTGFTQELNHPAVQQARSHIPVAVGVLAGLRNRLTDQNLLQQQIQAIRDRQYAGVSFFFYETLNGRDNMLQQLFSSPAQRPLVASAQRR